MSISRIDHVSIAVKDLHKAERFFSEVLGAVTGTHAADPKMGYAWQLYSLGDLSRLELISPTGEDSFLSSFLADREGGVHHITLQTPDIQEVMARLDASGIPYFGYNTYPGGIWTEIFIHPRNAFGVLIQIAQFEADDWLADSVKFPKGEKWRVAKTSGGASLQFAHPGGGKVSLDLDDDEFERLIAALQDQRS